MLFLGSFKNQAEKYTLKAKNTQILLRLQILLTNTSLLSLTTNTSQTNVLLLYRVFIYKTDILYQLYKFWKIFRGGVANKRFYKVSIRGMRLRLPEL